MITEHLRATVRAGLRTGIYILVAMMTLTLMGLSVAHACMGVKRTITVSSFNAHMGTGASGGIGLRRGEVVLTFDDGPLGNNTARVLKALSRECVKATFFPVGAMARANPGMLQRIARAGHTIGHHTDGHANLPRLSAGAAARQIDNGVRNVNRALGPYRSRSTKLFRYPYLARSARLDKVLRSRGLLPFSAGIMSQDWKRGSGEAMVNRVMSQLNRRGSGVILLHDIQGRTAAALPSLLKRLKKGGYRIVHIRGRGQPSAPKSRQREADAPVVLASARKKNRVARLSSRKQRRAAILAERTTVTKPRRSIFAFLLGGRNIDRTATGSVRKTTRGRKPKVQSYRTAKRRDARPGKPRTLAAWFRARREAAAARRAAVKKGSGVSSRKRITKRKAKASSRKRVSRKVAKRSTKAKSRKSKLPWWLRPKPKGESLADFKKRIRAEG